MARVPYDWKVSTNRFAQWQNQTRETAPGTNSLESREVDFNECVGLFATVRITSELPVIQELSTYDKPRKPLRRELLQFRLKVEWT
jgi:hypothetical protein